MPNSKPVKMNSNADTCRFDKRIGGIVYDIGVYFKKDATETMEKKITRLIKNDMEAVS
ncbi:MAG: transposon-encoded TnpW family protein [Lachnospiraceae bacterium]|nr:transposon-encoded TnpW family protein [Lachnospiraceae bacterium]